MMFATFGSTNMLLGRLLMVLPLPWPRRCYMGRKYRFKISLLLMQLLLWKQSQVEFPSSSTTRDDEQTTGQAAETRRLIGNSRSRKLKKVE